MWCSSSEGISDVVISEKNAKLQGLFTRVEIEIAMGQLFPIKAPGVDGMPSLFYQKRLGDCGR